MWVNEDQVAALRAYLALRPDEAERLHVQLTQSDSLEGYGEFVYAAFVTAVREHFGETWSVSDVVRLVATVRAELGRDGYDIDPLAAETQVRLALGDRDAHAGADEETRARVRLSMLGELIYQRHLDDSALDAFLADARTLAERAF